MQELDYLAIGHMSRDATPSGYALGGTVSYAGVTAQALGCRTAVFTSGAAADSETMQLPGSVETHFVPAAASTTFDNIYTAEGRKQILHSVAVRLTAAQLPDTWRTVPIVHFGPVANEIDPEMIAEFERSFIGFTPQGWMRRWDETGHVFARAWEQAAVYLPQATAVVLSEEDLLNQEMLQQYRRWSRLLVLTRGYNGCTVFRGDQVWQIPAPTVNEVEPTGAGDIFAAAFFVKYAQTEPRDPVRAAEFANGVAAQTVSAVGLPAKLARIHQYLVSVSWPGVPRLATQGDK